MSTRDTTDMRCRSGGTGIAVKGNIPSEPLWPFSSSDVAPAGCEGRLAARYAHPTMRSYGQWTLVTKSRALGQSDRV